MKNRDADQLFSELCELHQEIDDDLSHVEIGYLFDSVREESTAGGRRWQVAKNALYAAASLRKVAERLERYATEMHRRASRCKEV